ncbi:MAG: PIG-L deacetylase family protein [Candidatus Hodarchaeota archaeon]
MGKEKFVFISTHLDDAVESCGGLIAKLSSAGESVEVSTVYSAKPDINEIPPSLKDYANYDERLEEDKNAMEVLGVKASHMNYLERPFNKPYYQKLHHILISPDEGLDGYMRVDDLAADIINLLESPDVRCVYAPLAIGNHVDHMTVFLASLKALESTAKFDTIHFYEDSYAFAGNPVRKKHWVARSKLHPWSKDPRFASFKTMLLSLFFRLHLKTDSIDEGAEMLCNRYTWEVNPEDISGFVEKKEEAISCYASQVAPLGGMSVVKKLHRKYMEFWGNCEPIWIARPK